MVISIRSCILITLILAVAYFAKRGEVVNPQVTETRWVKIDFDGNEMHNWAGPWSCVLDKETGLVWENKDINEGIHDANWMYSWYDEKGVGVPDRGDCNFNNVRCDTQDIIIQARRENTCGINTWRLPTSAELKTILNTTPLPAEPMINGDFFPYTKRSDYWTSEHGHELTGGYSKLGQGAIAVNFAIGVSRATPYRNVAYVRLVSGAN